MERGGRGRGLGQPASLLTHPGRLPARPVSPRRREGLLLQDP